MPVSVRKTPTLSWNKSFPRTPTPIIAFHYPDRWKDERRHAHDFFEIQLCVKGRGKQLTEKGIASFHKGDAIFLRPGAWHAAANNHRVDAYVCCFGISLLLHELLWTLDEPTLNFLLWRQSPDKTVGTFRLHLEEQAFRLCIKHLKALAELGEVEKPHSRALRLGHLTFILAALGEAVPSNKIKQQTDYPLVHPAVKRAIYLFSENIAGEWSLGKLTNLLNINMSYLGRLFYKTLGKSPMVYLSQIRAEQASRLLLRTSKSISEIAAQVGWPELNHFARRFRAHFGISATEYRRHFAASNSSDAAINSS